ATAFIDVNANGVLDRQATFSKTVASPALNAGTGLLAGTLVSDPLPIAGFAGAISDLKVTLNVQKTGTGAVTFALLSPAGFVAATGPNLLTLSPATATTTASFNGSLLDAADAS